MSKRLSFTENTKKLVDEITSINGDLIFHQSGGCCDGSAPMCFPRSEFRVGSRDRSQHSMTLLVVRRGVMARHLKEHTF